LSIVTATPGVIKIDSHDPDMTRIREVAHACKEGKVVDQIIGAVPKGVLEGKVKEQLEAA